MTSERAMIQTMANEAKYQIELMEDDALYCESCGIEIDGESGVSVDAPGIPAGEIIACHSCAKRIQEAI